MVGKRDREAGPPQPVGSIPILSLTAPCSQDSAQSSELRRGPKNWICSNSPPDEWHSLARDLKLPKLIFQVIRRTIATLAQKKGTVKDIQGLPGHSRAATTN
jgi:hypothetical protein